MASTAPEASIDPGRVLGRGFEALRANVPPFFGIALLLVGLPDFLGAWLARGGGDMTGPAPLAIAGSWGQTAASLGAWLVSVTLLRCVLARSTILHLGGRGPDLAGSLLLALRLLLRGVAASLYALFLIAVGLVCMIVPGIVVWCALMVVIPALVEERGGVMASIDRSWNLTRGSRLQIFALGAMFWIFSLIVFAIAGLVTGASLLDSTADRLVHPLLAATIEAIASSLTEAIVAVLTAALYFELREVKEGPGANALTEVFG
jgi:hypothetical protein